jgi:hypothetical protein
MKRRTKCLRITIALRCSVRTSVGAKITEMQTIKCIRFARSTKARFCEAPEAAQNVHRFASLAESVDASTPLRQAGLYHTCGGCRARTKFDCRAHPQRHAKAGREKAGKKSRTQRAFQINCMVTQPKPILKERTLQSIDKELELLLAHDDLENQLLSLIHGTREHAAVYESGERHERTLLKICGRNAAGVDADLCRLREADCFSGRPVSLRPLPQFHFIWSACASTSTMATSSRKRGSTSSFGATRNGELKPATSSPHVPARRFGCRRIGEADCHVAGKVRDPRLELTSTRLRQSLAGLHQGISLSASALRRSIQPPSTVQSCVTSRRSTSTRRTSTIHFRTRDERMLALNILKRGG